MTTYGPAVEKLVAELGRRDYQELVRQSGAGAPAPDRLAVRCLGQDYLVTYPGGEVTTGSGEAVDEHLAILLLLYLTEAGGRLVEGRWIAFEQISGGAGYIASFRGRVVAPLLRTFGQRPEALLEAAARLDGSSLDMGDAAVVLVALPRIPVAFVLWRGDDEFAPSASVVFDASIEGYLDAEAATVLAELATRRMIEAAGSGPNKGGLT
ncbi:MAG: DUF3786 domain-containing protein [Chloroflexota bacterium]|jgi:hypothetical protein